jgi:hypothetical protein
MVQDGDETKAGKRGHVASARSPQVMAACGGAGGGGRLCRSGGGGGVSIGGGVGVGGVGGGGGPAGEPVSFKRRALDRSSKRPLHQPPR